MLPSTASVFRISLYVTTIWGFVGSWW